MNEISSGRFRLQQTRIIACTILLFCNKKHHKFSKTPTVLSDTLCYD